jgi:hypothetical protein
LRGQPSQPAQPAPARQARPPAPPPPAFAPELVALGLGEGELELLLTEGFGLIETVTLAPPRPVAHRLSAPAGVTLEAARARVRELPSAPAVDFNHYYRTGQSPEPAAMVASPPCAHANCWAHELVGWPADGPRGESCRIADTAIGVIDTDINPAHEFLAGAQVELVTLRPAEADASGRVHGTAVLSALAAPPGGRVAGLLPEARYVVADIFARAGGDERADVVSLLRALDLMAARGVRVVNLSLAGPANEVLDRAIADLVARHGMVLVAAVGNGGGTRPVAHPAAHPQVIAVTAVDRRGRGFGGAQRGEEVDLAAPGVELLLATSVRGARPQTGTSFAVPFVTAAAALLIEAEPGLTAAEVADRLRASARDIGPEGPDELFGHGLLDIADLCR